MGGGGGWKRERDESLTVILRADCSPPPQYHMNKMYQEALNTYSLIVKNKQYAGVSQFATTTLCAGRQWE